MPVTQALVRMCSTPMQVVMKIIASATMVAFSPGQITEQESVHAPAVRRCRQKAGEGVEPQDRLSGGVRAQGAADHGIFPACDGKVA